jgi:MraZ protein
MAVILSFRLVLQKVPLPKRSCSVQSALDSSGMKWDVVVGTGIAVFNGRFDHAIDDKGRVSIPARFREVLQREGHDRLYITNFMLDRERLLELYPPNEWDKVVAKFSGSRATDREAQLFETFYIGGAHEVPVDRQGRVLVPPRLRDFARLGREVIFSAKHNRFELWDKGTLERILRSAEENLQNPEFLAKINI